jgi:peptidyl-prolyl cis-trans isomerase SurA
LQIALGLKSFNMKNLSQFVILLLLVNTSIFAQKGTPKNTQVLFTVNKKPISVEEFIYLYDKNHKGRPEEFTKAKIEEYLNLYIRFKLKVEEARQRGMDTTAKFRKEFTGYKEALRKPYLPDNKLIDSLTQLTYNRLKEEVKAAHILIRLPPEESPADTLAAWNKIVDIKKRIDAGEDFGTLAMTVSEDPSAKSNEGNLGYFTAMQMVYPFETGAFTTDIGKVSNPVRTRFGYHLIKVADKRPAIGEVEVSHILIRTGKDRDMVKAKQQIFEIYDRLQSGMKWEELCKQYSEDQSSKDSGGKLRPFGVGAMASVPEFERTAFALQTPGEYAAPFSTQYGWHIVKLEQKIPLPSYKEMESSLKSKVSRDERMQTAKASIQKNLRSKYAFVENADTKKQVLATADSTLQQATWKKPSGAINDAALFSLGGSNNAASAFFDYVLANQKQNKQAPSAYLNQMYENFVNNRIELAVEDNLMKTNADYRYLSNEYYEGILLFDIMEKEVWNRASEDTLGQLDYFNANIIKYTAGERAQAIIYSSAKASALDEVQKQVENDSTLSEAKLKKYGIRAERGKFEKNERAVLAHVPWKVGQTRVELDGNYYLVRIEQILPAGMRTFEESKGLLISDYQTNLENTWLESLQKKYAVKINGKSKKYVLGKLATSH